MTGMTTEQLEAIRKRATLATEGPWTEFPVLDRTEWAVLGGGIEVLVSEGVYENNDAEFIAASREDVPALLAEVERLQAESIYWRMEHEHQRRQAELYLEKYKAVRAENERLERYFTIAEVYRNEPEELSKIIKEALGGDSE